MGAQSRHRLVWGAKVSPAPQGPGGGPGPPPPVQPTPQSCAPWRMVPNSAPGSKTGHRGRVPPRLPPEATARGCWARRCRPGPGSPSGRGTPGRGLGAGSGVRVRGRGRAGSQRLPHTPRHSAPRPRAHRGSPRAPPPRPPVKGARHSGVAASAAPPPGSPHLARPPPVSPPERAFPRLQLHSHVPQSLHGARPSDGLRVPRPANLPPRADAGRQPMAALGAVGGGAPRQPRGRISQSAGPWRGGQWGSTASSRRAAPPGGVRRTARRGCRRWRRLRGTEAPG